MSEQRHLDWQGCFNVRDLGGLPTEDGRLTLSGALVRADALDKLTNAGWQALLDYGVRTVIDLRNEDERGGDRAARPAALRTVELALDPVKASQPASPDGRPRFGTPLLYRPHLQRYPERSAAVIGAIARAQPGGVVFHCVAGRDRSGQIAMLALALAGVSADVIAADYALSHERLRPLFAAAGEDDQGPMLQAFLSDHHTDAEQVIATTLSSLDVESQLRAGGLSDEDLALIRERLLGPSPAASRA
jgi:protein-tyrosine phosphatase